MPATFDRALSSAKFDKVENGKSLWDAPRSIWQDDAAAVDGRRPTAVRQASSSNRLSKTLNGTALATIENPRNAINDTGSIWGNTSNQRQTKTSTSPTKSKNSGWLYESKEHDIENSSSLLAGSAPEFEPYGKENAQTKGRSLRLSGDALAYDAQFVPSFRPTGPSQLPAPNRALTNGAGYSAIPTALNHGNSGSSTNGHPQIQQLYGLGMDSSPLKSRFPGRSQPSTDSPNAARFARQMNSYLDRTVGAVEEPANSHRDLGWEKKAPKFADYHHTQSDLDRGIYVVQSDLSPHRMAGVYEGDNHYETGAYYDQEYIADQSQHWNQVYAGLDGRSRLEYLSDGRNANSGYYSASLTPTSGTESRIESGATSRASHNELMLANRKLGGEGYATYGSNGVLVPVDFRGYGAQMNPLAPSYPYYGFPGHFLPRDELKPLPIRSALLEEFRLHRTTKRYELRDIFDHVVEFSGDQHGSRFIQQKLETANSDDKEQVFKEIQSNSLQLMTDLFGNYVIQKLFEHGSQSQKRSLADSMRGHVAALSLQMYGCRVVQKALEYVLTDQQATIVQELDGPQRHIIKVIKDQNGNHVVQKAIERVPAEHIQFIVEAHRGDVVRLAQHTYGCRVIQRILEYCTPAAKRIILDEVLVSLQPLITDAFGNYVVQHVIQKGEPSDRRRVIETVLQQLLVYSKHKFASNVVEMCLEHADEDQRARMVSKLIGVNAESGQTSVLSLLRDQYGNYVIQKVFGLLTGVPKAQLEAEMHACFMQLKRTSYGKQVVAIEKLLYGGAPTLALPAPPAPSSQQQQHPQPLHHLTQAQQPAPKAMGRAIGRSPPQIQFGSQPPLPYRHSQHHNIHHNHRPQQHYYAAPQQHAPGIATR